MSTANTGSKGALVATTVISIIVAVAMAIWSIISYVNADKATKDLAKIQSEYREIAPTPSAASITALREARGRAGSGFTPSQSLIDVAITQRDNLKTFLAGSVGSDTEATQAATDAIVAAKAAVGTQLADGSVVDVIAGLTQQVTALKASNAQLTATVAQANAKVEQTLQATTAQMQTNSQAVTDATKQASDVAAAAEAFRTEKDGLVTAAQKATVDATQSAEEQTRNQNTQLAVLTRRLQQAETQTKQAQTELAKLRVPVDQIVRQADGKVIRTPDADRVIIDIGSGQGVAPGLTFEIFDPLGVPRVTSEDAGEDSLLKGKASIEIIRVQPGSSEARIIRSTPGASVREGDLIVNLVFDRNVKYNFVVYGRFNLDRRGESSVRDGDSLKRLVSQWGGAIADGVSINTDFLVLGEEPVVPPFTQNDLQDPIKARQFEEASRDLEAYNDVRSKAQSLSIPILNQTRFLYLVGYYEESTR